MRPATLEEVEQIISERLAELERRIMPEALTVRDVAARLRLSVRRVNELVYSGALASYTIGRARRVDPGDLADFIADQRRQPTPIRRTAATTPGRISGASWLAELWQEAYDHAGG